MGSNSLLKFLFTIVILVLIGPPLFIIIGSFIMSLILVLVILLVLALSLISLPILLFISPSSLALGVPTLALLFFGIAALSLLVFLISLIIKCIGWFGRLVLNIMRRFLG